MINHKTKPNIILASFPRSGNTFLRNVLYEVYGIYSWNNNNVFKKNRDKYLKLLENIERNSSLIPRSETKFKVLSEKFKYLAIKSHDLPSKTLQYCDKGSRIIYLVRDGRDALVSMAHHRKDIVEPGTDFTSNLKTAIKAHLGSYFGGWSRNVSEWTKIADRVIRFEDFIKDPLKYTEEFRSFMKMPEPQIEKLPDFESQKKGSSHFGGSARKHYTEEERKDFNNKFFRKGQVGGWKDEMPENLHDLFWKKNKIMMEQIGYTQDGKLNDFV